MKSSKFNPVRDAEMFSRSLKTHFISPGDIKAMVGWLEMPKNQNAAVDAVAFAPDPKKDDAFVDFIASAPEFQGWERSEIQAALDQADAQNLMEAGNVMENKKTTTKGTLGKLVAEAVQKGLAKALQKKKVTKISSTQLAEGIRKAVKKVLQEQTMAAPGRDGSGQMAGGAMPPAGKGAVAGMAAPTQEGVSDGDMKRGSSTFGQIPSPEELQQAIDDAGGWDMDLRGSDSEAFDAAMEAAGLSSYKAYSMMQSGEGMHKVISALMSLGDAAELPDGMEQEEFSEMVQNAESLASSIMDVLGWEWI